MTALTVDALRATLRYDRETGSIVHRPRLSDQMFSALHAGRPALASVHKRGKLFGKILGHQIFAHKAAWAIHYGELRNDIYHLNDDPTDNRLCNLRARDALADCLLSEDEIRRNVLASRAIDEAYHNARPLWREILKDYGY